MNLERLLDRPIAFQRVFMDLGAGASGALLLSQAVYWSRRTSNSEKWFYKTIQEWTEETGLSRHEQDGARKKLKGKGILEIVKKGVPCRTFYRVNFERLAEVLSEITATNKTAEKRQTSLPKFGKLACDNSANLPAENQQTITEITTEITTENKILDIMSDSDESNAPAVVEDSARFDAKAKGAMLTQAFEYFWSAYQHKNNRKAAQKSFLKIQLPPNQQDAFTKLQFVINQAQRWGDLYRNGPDDQKQFQPNASTWINNERWSDEQLPMIRKNHAASDWASEMLDEERF